MVALRKSISLLLLLCWGLAGPAQSLQLEEISLGNHPIHEVSQDSSGMIWLATGNGLFSWAPLGGFRPLSAEETPFLDVRKVHHFRSGAWVLTTQGLYRLTDNHQLAPHGLSDLRENRIIDIAIDESGNTWFLGLNQLFLLLPDRTQKVWTFGELGVEYPARLELLAGRAYLMTEKQGMLLESDGNGVRLPLEALPEVSAEKFRSPGGVLCFELGEQSLTARLEDDPNVRRKIPVSGPIRQTFQDRGGNIWISFGTDGLEVLTSESFEHLAGAMRLEHSLGLEPGERILTIAGHDHRAVILTTTNKLHWCNRLEAKESWQLQSMEDPELLLTHQHVLIRDQEGITIISLVSGRMTTVHVSGLSQLSVAGELVTIGQDNQRYGSLDADFLETLVDHPDPNHLMGQLAPQFMQLFAREVLFLPSGKVVVQKDQELAFFQSDSVSTPFLTIPGRFTPIVFWRSDSLLARSAGGNLMVLAPDAPVSIPLPILEDGQVNRIAVAPETNLIWLCDGKNVWCSRGISGLLSRNITCLIHNPLSENSAAWNYFLLGVGSAEDISLLTYKKMEAPAGELFIDCVRWETCQEPWKGYRMIPLDSTVFTIEFESSILAHPFDQILEVRINDQPWQVVDHASFTIPQLNPGEYQISARLRAGGVVLDQQDGLLLFSLRSPFYESWWFVFIGLMMLAGLIWAGLTLYYGEHERKRLESQVQDRTKDLDRFVHELKQKNEDLEQFAYIASHDLKSPLRGVIGHLQLFLRKNQNQIDQAGQDSINYAIAESKRLYEMVNDLLDFASVGSGKMDKKPLVMNRLLESVRQSILLQRRGQPGEITLDEFPRIHAVPSQFEALFRNLIENGLKFNESDRPHVSISYEETEDLHRFRVADNGIGMNEAYVEKAFELYGRLNPDYPGTGIGLAICRRVVERHGGILSLEKSDSSGSVFLISLPKTDGEILA